MDSAGQVGAKVISAFNGRVLKEPKGFIKVLEFILSIFAFATTCSFANYIKFGIKCSTTAEDEDVYTMGFGYPFTLTDVSTYVYSCNRTQTISFFESTGSAAQFYVFVGVIVMLYSAAAVVFYVFFDEMYRKNNRFIVADFITSIVLTALWLISSSAWAQGLSDTKYYTNPTTIFTRLDTCKSDTSPICTSKFAGNFASLDVSIIFGFLNMAVWAGNLWFLWKETPWFKNRQGAPQETYSPEHAAPSPGSNV